jgi:hypothetical protein
LLPLGQIRVAVYTPPMIVAEKIRAICQQMPEYSPIVGRTHDTSRRARDFLDIHTICVHPKARIDVDFKSADFHALVRHVFAAKRVPLKLIGKISETRDFHEPDFVSVLDTIKEDTKLMFSTFAPYFNFVVRKCKSLKPLWHEYLPS